MASLALVHDGRQLPEPPYPPDTKTKGWRFELDYERALGSDTWALCPPEIRPWLLMLWAEAWRAVPAGTFSNDDQVIAARIGMPLNLFRAHREVLMRKWVLHADGRLYHHVVTERVLSLIGYRNAETERKAAYRSRQRNQEDAQIVTRVSRGTPVGETPPEPEPEPEPGLKERTKTKRLVAPTPKPGPIQASQICAESGLSPEVVAEWLAVRKRKRAVPLSPFAWRIMHTEAEKARISVAQAIRHCAERGWIGFRAEYLARPGPGAAAAPEDPKAPIWREARAGAKALLLDFDKVKFDDRPVAEWIWHRAERLVASGASWSIVDSEAYRKWTETRRQPA